MIVSVQVNYLDFTVWIKSDKAQECGLYNRQDIDSETFLYLVSMDNCCHASNPKISAVSRRLH